MIYKIIVFFSLCNADWKKMLLEVMLMNFLLLQCWLAVGEAIFSVKVKIQILDERNIFCLGCKDVCMMKYSFILFYLISKGLL